VGIALGVARYRPAVWTDDRWRGAYEDGSLDYFGSVQELARYSLLVGHLGNIGRGSSILDVGCGPGLLRQRIPDEWVGSYVGVDPTANAIAEASSLDAPRSRFVTGTVADLVAAGDRFDVVFCNEVLSVVPDPEALVDDVTTAVRPGGHVLTSIWHHPGDSVLWKLLDERLELIDLVEVRNPANRHGPDGWRVTCHRRAS
jgi:2-polyprenyl-3-methyl-5-hydroxy-6-metoxy-1,4-benzoquinol methylase